MLTQLLIGTLMLALTVVWQALAFDFIIRKTQNLTHAKINKITKSWKSIILTIVTLSVSFVLIFEVWIWGMLYLIIGVFTDLETALYFSTSSFTTVGFGDVYLGKDWRLLSTIEAMNGFILFGWSTAFIFEIVSNVYKKEGAALK